MADLRSTTQDGTSSLSPEWRLLLRACAGNSITTADLRELDWRRVVRSASEHDLGPRLYYSLRECPSLDGDGEEALAEVKAQYFATGLRNALVNRELVTLLDSWRSCGVAAIVLKGAALGAGVYRNSALRPMRDVDLLVRGSDMARIEEFFADSGYQLDPGQRDRKDWYDRHHYHLTFEKRSEAQVPIRYEVHWLLERPGRPFAIDTDGLWSRAAELSIGNARTRTLSPEDMLLHLCLHVCKHRLAGGFRGLCDIAAVIRFYDARLDWNQVGRRAAEWRTQEFTYVPLLVVRRLLHVDVPASVIASLAPGGVDEKLVAAAIAEALTDRTAAALFPEFFALRYGASAAERMRTIRTVVAREADAQRQSGTRRHPWSYYPGRVRHVLKKYGAQFWLFSRQRQLAMAEVERRNRLTAWLTPFGEEQIASAPPLVGA